ncbi:MAG: CRISPR-associated helicase Cas3' [Thermoflexaceae bacterium]|nr:CRISPR-associated helicase Cas3' [Thermoflexaceae bacterium]
MQLLAHLTMENGIRKEQSLKEHCMKTAEYAGECLKIAGFYNTAYLAGLLHDMGKATEKFNNYLEKSFAGEDVVRGSVNHTFAGVIYLLEKYHDEKQRWKCLTSEIISYVIGAHHGIFDCLDLDGNNGFCHRLEKDKGEICYEEAIKNFIESVSPEKEINEYFLKATEEIQSFFEAVQKDNNIRKQDEAPFQVGLLCRLLLSAVIYGDRRDTREFMDSGFCVQKNDIDWKVQRMYLESKISQFNTSSALNQVRSNISKQCLEFSDNPTGIYRLNVPTGAGKTLCSLRYALAHAEKFHKKRIIFIIPLLSILDQNARVIKDNIANKDLVLEHHSNVIYEDGDVEEVQRYELLADNWNAPIIVSTMVQLLNIFFTHKTSAIGRMSALCDSVIVIDEIQSLPKKVTLMFNEAMNFLSKFCNSTIILSSATQPCLEEVQWPINYANNADMVHLNSDELNVFRRAEIIDRTNPYGMDMDECSEFCCNLAKEYQSLLIICNTKNQAREIYRKMQECFDKNEISIFHLSTSMCQKHRKNIFLNIQKELAEVQIQSCKEEARMPVICVATQLVEAGVDVSFECVVRIMAGIDNLAQAAGRCNRSNEYKNGGKVYLINLKNENLRNLPEIESAKISTRKVLEMYKNAEGIDLIGELAARKYYQYLYQEVRKELKYPVKDCGETLYLAELLANKNNYARKKEVNYFLRYPFKTAGQKFKVFDEDTIDVIVPYEEGERIIDEIRKLDYRKIEFEELNRILKEAKAYTISIFQWQKDKLEEYGYLESCCENKIFLLNPKAYHFQYGLGNIEEQSIENFII